MSFQDRADAGRQLAERLRDLSHEDVVVLGIPRGGVPVAFEVADGLGAPLDVLLVRKLGVPFQPELAMGAIGEEGVRILNRQVIRSAGLKEAEFVAVEERERRELERRAERFRGTRPRVPLAGRTAVVIDDGIATGASARAACSVARALGASRVILAVPVAPRSSIGELRTAADDVVCLATPEPFFAVGQWYWDFSQTSDDEVLKLLERAAASSALRDAPERGGRLAVRDADDEVAAGPVCLAGHLTVPSEAPGVVVFAHGSGSSRHSPRNRYVATALNEAGIGTLLFDLLTPEEELDRRNVFDIELLAERLTAVTRWLRDQPESAGAEIGYFGASTGAAAALRAAAAPDACLAAVVSRGGRPDLAGPSLADVRAATLLIVGGDDDAVLELNRRALADLTCERRLQVIPGATHLFEEPGALEAVAGLAGDWFTRHLVPAAQPAT